MAGRHRHHLTSELLLGGIIDQEEVEVSASCFNAENRMCEVV